MDAMVVSGAIACLGLSAAGSAFGTGFAASSAVGAWKKCYAANKPAPFILLGLVGAPITQTLYGMILMFIMLGKTGVAGAGVPLLILGIFAGLGVGLSALFQGRTAAAACDAVSSRPSPSSRWCSRSSPSARSGKCPRRRKERTNWQRLRWGRCFSAIHGRRWWRCASTHSTPSLTGSTSAMVVARTRWRRSRSCSR